MASAEGGGTRVGEGWGGGEGAEGTLWEEEGEAEHGGTEGAGKPPLTGREVGGRGYPRCRDPGEGEGTALRGPGGREGRFAHRGRGRGEGRSVLRGQGGGGKRRYGSKEPGRGRVQAEGNGGRRGRVHTK